MSHCSGTLAWLCICSASWGASSTMLKEWQLSSLNFQYAKHAEAPRQRDVIETVKGAQLTIDLRCNSSERCLHPNQQERNQTKVESRLSVRISGGARAPRRVATMQGNVHEHASRALL
jgi:hypothetical protein